MSRLDHVNDTAQLSREIAAFLISESRESDLESVMRDVMRLRRSQGVLEADVQSAHELDAATLVELTELIRQEFPAAKQVVTDQTIRSELIGGVRIATADEQLDMTVRGKLDTFKRLTHGGTV